MTLVCVARNFNFFLFLKKRKSITFVYVIGKIYIKQRWPSLSFRCTWKFKRYLRLQKLTRDRFLLSYLIGYWPFSCVAKSFNICKSELTFSNIFCLYSKNTSGTLHPWLRRKNLFFNQETITYHPLSDMRRKIDFYKKEFGIPKLVLWDALQKFISS